MEHAPLVSISSGMDGRAVGFGRLQSRKAISKDPRILCRLVVVSYTGEASIALSDGQSKTEIGNGP